MFGFLTVDKPAGLTSRQVVDWIAAACRPIKVGHAGTLDPLATGVLVICIGPATRLVGHVQRMAKRYVAQFRLGYESDTEDITGELTPVPIAGSISRESIDVLLPKFTGRIWQTPPKYSALKIRGKRAYDLARLGSEFELAPREVDVYQIRLLQFAFPDFEIEIECGSGTYVRSIGREIGRALGSAAVMTSLTRTAIGCFNLESAIKLEGDSKQLQLSHIEGRLIAPVEGLVQGLQMGTAILSQQQINDLKVGKSVRWDEGLGTEEEWLAVNAAGQLMAVMSTFAGLAKPKINFANHAGA